MVSSGDTFAHAIFDMLRDYAYQSPSTEIERHCDGLHMNLITLDDRDVPKRLKRTAVRQPDVSRYSMVIMNAPTFRGNKFQVGGSKK